MSEVTHEQVAENAKRRDAKVHQLRNRNGHVVATFEPAETTTTCKWLWIDGNPTFLFSDDVAGLVAFLTNDESEGCSAMFGGEPCTRPAGHDGQCVTKAGVNSDPPGTMYDTGQSTYVVCSDGVVRELAS